MQSDDLAKNAITKKSIKLSLTLANDIMSHPIILGIEAIISDCNSAKQSNIQVFIVGTFSNQPK